MKASVTHVPDFDPRPRVLKHDECLGVFAANGDLQALQWPECGLFYRDTRHLSDFSLRLNGQAPVLMASLVDRDNSLFTVHLTNPDFEPAGPRPLSRGFLHLRRTRLLWRDTMHERLTLHNFGDLSVIVKLTLTFAADFADMFEVRGLARATRGRMLPAQLDDTAVTLGYEGLDGLRRSTHVAIANPAPSRLDAGGAEFDLSLEAGRSQTVMVTVSCAAGDAEAPEGMATAIRRATRARRARAQAAAHIYTTNELFNEWANQAHADLVMLTTETPHGPYPYAGTPWFSCPFGRDALIVGLMTLWADPALSRGVLNFLAVHQATGTDPRRDAQPGKIVHEMRHGEMAATGEVPFAAYYGSVDATPLFVVLAGAYWQRTRDLAFIQTIWPKVEAALDWISGAGDPDGDGFVEYAAAADTGLVNQGWKDSGDAVFHADGTSVTGPVALVEVQGYVYAALRAGAELAVALDRRDAASAWLDQANRLRRRFHEVFWLRETSTYALALDGNKRPCAVVASNAGHALFAGIALEEVAATLADRLMTPSMVTRWGLRTLARGQPRYNPMSYHNGSIWPHDTALVAIGLARYGYKHASASLADRLFNAAIHLEGMRLPELFCGFDSSRAEGPVRYAGACVPQAWTSAVPTGLIGALLGLRIDVARPRVTLEQPMLPGFLDGLHLRGLSVGPHEIDIAIRGCGTQVGVEIERRSGDVEVVVRQ